MWWAVIIEINTLSLSLPLPLSLIHSLTHTHTETYSLSLTFSLLHGSFTLWDVTIFNWTILRIQILVLVQQNSMVFLHSWKHFVILPWLINNPREHSSVFYLRKRDHKHIYTSLRNWRWFSHDFFKTIIKYYKWKSTSDQNIDFMRAAATWWELT